MIINLNYILNINNVILEIYLLFIIIYIFSKQIKISLFFNYN